jgi:hypothetical protein
MGRTLCFTRLHWHATHCAAATTAMAEAAANILVSTTGAAMLSDFGAARVLRVSIPRPPTALCEWLPD